MAVLEMYMCSTQMNPTISYDMFIEMMLIINKYGRQITSNENNLQQTQDNHAVLFVIHIY